MGSETWCSLPVPSASTSRFHRPFSARRHGDFWLNAYLVMVLEFFFFKSGELWGVEVWTSGDEKIKCNFQLKIIFQTSQQDRFSFPAGFVLSDMGSWQLCSEPSLGQHYKETMPLPLLFRGFSSAPASLCSPRGTLSSHAWYHRVGQRLMAPEWQNMV